MFLFRWIYPEPWKKSIAGETVLITGGGSGIGRLMAIKLSKLGAIIVTWDVNTAGNEETVRYICTTWSYIVIFSFAIMIIYFGLLC